MRLETYRFQKQPTNFSEEANFFSWVYGQRQRVDLLPSNPLVEGLAHYQRAADGTESFSRQSARIDGYQPSGTCFAGYSHGAAALAGLSREVADHIPKAVATGQLSGGHGNELSPAHHFA